jgi:nitrogen regulatory protein PII
MKLVILITALIENGLDIALAWEEAGAPGVTLIRSHGLHTLHGELSEKAELPRMVISMAAAMAHLLEEMEERNITLISAVEDHQVDALIDAASRVLGDLTAPNNGVLFVLPIERAIGVRSHRQG